jgi:hypothetical protein
MTASVNKSGLALVIGSSVLIWAPGGTGLTRLADDPAFTRAVDVVAVDASHAVVALPHSVVLVGPQTPVVLAGMSARVRWADDLLHVLDTATGIIWQARGLAALWTPRAQALHARRLIKALPKQAPESSPAFLEAVRLVGCLEARKLRG